MSPDDQRRLAEQIDQAHELAARGARRPAAEAFALARTMCVTLCDQARLDQVVTGTTAAMAREREQYRAAIAARRTGSRQLVVLADSLGLPRPDDKSGDAMGAERTYPYMLVDQLPEHGVDSYCQRYFTTRDVLDLLLAAPQLGAGADVVLHVGLNDCANRMFLERERLALDLLPAEIKDKIVGFAQKHRRVVLSELPSYHYVPPAEFRSNLASIHELLRARGMRRLVVATTILPPIRFWPATPGVQHNFGRYNQMLMELAAQPDARLFDVDRHVWARQHEGVLLPDGMHLTESGHRLFATEVANLLQ